MKTPKRPVRLILADYLGRPVSEVEHRVDPSRNRLAIYHVNGYYWCIPPSSERPSTGWEWVHVTDLGERKVYRAINRPAEK